MDERLFLKDIAPRPGNLPFPKGIRKGRFVDDGPACRVDQERRQFHPLQFPRPDQVMLVLEPQLQEELRQSEVRREMVIEGIAALQQGKTPEEVETIARQVAQ